VSFFLGAALAAGGILLGRLLARTMRQTHPGRGAAGGLEATGGDSLAGFACTLGDVLLRRAGRDEVWLTGALVFSESRPVAALLVASEPSTGRAVFVDDAKDAGVMWLSALSGIDVANGREPLHAIECAGVRFERTRRLPVRVELLGTGAPGIGQQAVIAVYEGPGAQRLVVVVGTEATAAWEGVALAQTDYEVLPGGRATLET
jgi:hypothetical protein